MSYRDRILHDGVDRPGWEAARHPVIGASDAAHFARPASVDKYLAAKIGHGKGYKYDPDTEEGFSGQNYFPDGMERRAFYAPKGEGHEAKIKARLDQWAEVRRRKAGEDEGE